MWSIYGNNIGPFLILTITGMLPVLLISYFIGNNVPGLLALSLIEILIVTTLAGAFIYSVPYYYVNGRVNLQTSLKASQSVYFKLLVVT